MKIALFPNRLKRNGEAIAQDVCSFLKSKGVLVYAEDDVALKIDAFALSCIDAKEVDIMITLGGDGTILRICHLHPDIDAPIMAINLGGFGFMADIPVKEIIPCLQKLVNGNYAIQERITMEGFSCKGEHCFAFNEIVIHRSQNHNLIDLKIHVDGNYLNTFSADGVIIATPTGSTAYSLSAGGPILTPELKAFVLTPISAHTISNRPIVFMPKREISIEYVNEGKEIEVTSDGYKSFAMASQEKYTIKPSQKLFKLIVLPGHDFPRILREKLGWSRKLKS